MKQVGVLKKRGPDANSIVVAFMQNICTVIQVTIDALQDFRFESASFHNSELAIPDGMRLARLRSSSHELDSIQKSAGR
jgi:hypothetical protein